MRARAATYFTTRVAPRALEAIQTLAGAALLTAICLLGARMVVPDLVYRGLTSQLASPVSIVGLFLLTVATVLLERELMWHGLAVGASVAADEMVPTEAMHVDPTPAPAPVAAAPVIELPESVTIVSVDEPDEPVLTLPETPVLQLVSHADPPEPRAEPIEDDPWWMPWMDRSRRSVFDATFVESRADSLRLDHDGARADHRSEELIPAA